ncbi:MarR family transcriptional regulator [Enterococcus sp. DIV0660C]|uniref:MarR family winged helix-turn-helix transcriptional regulator n=1 Tax=Enterococcus sp. DIV0660C TaxID=2230880 RepID=UPI001A8C8AEB|nr:MarR family transcriptional regulator [Enterococcus sp. DIV0660C]MBO0431229.1 MarR family transcriptional regulator [Enterococcus sp. DIV0660C]
MGKEETSAAVMDKARNVFSKMAWLNKLTMEKRLEGYQPSEVHCIEFIGKNQDSNVTKLASSLFMTRSAISKITKKLVTKGYIESYQKPDNKKEIYFKLTEKGRAVFDVHERTHEEFQKRDQAIFDQVTEQQYEELARFLVKYDQHLNQEIEKLDL